MHNQEVSDAFYWLLGEKIPNFVDDCLSNEPLDQGNVVKKVHEAGINLRLLGYIRSYIMGAR